MPEQRRLSDEQVKAAAAAALAALRGGDADASGPSSGSRTSEFSASTWIAPVVTALLAAAVGYVQESPAAALAALMELAPWAFAAAMVYTVCRTALKIVEAWPRSEGRGRPS